MLEFFRHNVLQQFVAILLVAAALWVGAFASPVAMPKPDGGVLYEVLYRWLHDSPTAATVVAFVLMLIEGFLLNYLLYRCRMVSHNTFLPMMLYVALMSCQASSHTLTTSLLLNLIVLLMLLVMLIRGTQPLLSSDAISITSVLFAIATMVSPRAVVLLVPLVVLLALYKLYNVREILLIVLGFLAPYIIWATIYFMNDQLHEALTALWNHVSSPHLAIGSIAVIDYVQLSVYMIVVVVALVVNNSVRQSRIVVDNNNNTIVLSLLFSALLAHAYIQLFPIDYQAFAIPTAYAASIMWLGVRRHWFWVVLFVLAAAATAVGAYVQL